MSAQNIFALGASKNIGYFAAIRLLGEPAPFVRLPLEVLMLPADAGATVTFLLRNLATLEQDEVIQTYVRSGKARLVQGDATVQDDLVRAWSTAAEGEGDVDLLLFTLGEQHFCLVD